MPETQKDFLFLHTRDLPYFRAFLRAVESRFYQDINLPQPTLDVGCGDGHFTQLTFDHKLDVGLDPWTGPIHEAGTRKVYDLLTEADGAAMPYPDAYFSSAISNSVLEHIPHLDAVLLETARVLKPGAPFVFCVPNHQFLPNLSVGWRRGVGAWRFAGVHQKGCFFHVTSQKSGQCLERAVNALVNGDSVVLRGLFQHPVHDLVLVARMAHTQAQAPVVAATHLGVDIAQAVVTRMAATKFELDLARRNVELVVGNQDFLWCDLEETRQCANRLARQVHEGLRLQQPYGSAMYGGARNHAVVALVHRQTGLEFTSQRVYPPETGVVTGGFIFWARISKANKQFDHVKRGS